MVLDEFMSYFTTINIQLVYEIMIDDYKNHSHSNINSEYYNVLQYKLNVKSKSNVSESMMPKS